jgi:hypothetical protein
LLNHRPWRVITTAKTTATIQVTVLKQTRSATLQLTSNNLWQADDPELLAMSVSSSIRASAILKLAHILKRFCINDVASHATIVNSPLRMRHHSQASFWEE